MLSFDTIRQFIRTHPGKVALVAIAAALYVAFNVWFFRYAKSGSTLSPSALWQTVTKSGPGFPKVTGPGPVTSSSVKKPTPTPTPTPRPTGPGAYACDPYGQCNLYSDDMRKQYCTKTYADSLCLDACARKDARCSK